MWSNACVRRATRGVATCGSHPRRSPAPRSRASTFLADRVLFVCTGNSARSQLAAALWNLRSEVQAESAGTHPAREVHPGAIRAGRKAGVDLTGARPRAIDQVPGIPDLVVTVCDRAHEELGALTGEATVIHWWIPDPREIGTDRRLRGLGHSASTSHRHAQPPSRPHRTPPITEEDPPMTTSTDPSFSVPARHPPDDRVRDGTSRRRVRGHVLDRDDPASRGRVLPVLRRRPLHVVHPALRRALHATAAPSARACRGEDHGRGADGRLPLRAQRGPVTDGRGLVAAISPATARRSSRAARTPAAR